MKYSKTCKVSVYSYNSNKLPEISSTFIYSSGWLESETFLSITWDMHQKNFNGVSDRPQIKGIILKPSYAQSFIDTIDNFPISQLLQTRWQQNRI